MKKKIVIIKIKNPNSKASSRIINEGKFLNMLNKKGIGPKLHFYNRDFIIMDYIKGDFIIDFIEKNKNNRRKIIKIIKKVLCQMYKLDKMKINKLEMTFPYKHIIIRGETPYLIDFERCYYTKNPKNVTQFLHFIATSGIIELSKIIFYARRYKKNQSLKNFKNIIDKIK